MIASTPSLAAATVTICGSYRCDCWSVESGSNAQAMDRICDTHNTKFTGGEKRWDHAAAKQVELCVLWLLVLHKNFRSLRKFQCFS